MNKICTCAIRIILAIVPVFGTAYGAERMGGKMGDKSKMGRSEQVQKAAATVPVKTVTVASPTRIVGSPIRIDESVIAQPRVDKDAVAQRFSGPNAVVSNTIGRTPAVTTMRRDRTIGGVARHRRPVDRVRRGTRYVDRGIGYYTPGYSNYVGFVPGVISTTIFTDDGDVISTLPEAFDRIVLLRREINILREEVALFREALNR